MVTSGQPHLTPQHPPRDASPAGLVKQRMFLFPLFYLFMFTKNLNLITLCTFSRLLSIAEETLTAFLSKATGTAVEWVQMPGMKVHNRYL